MSVNRPRSRSPTIDLTSDAFSLPATVPGNFDARLVFKPKPDEIFHFNGRYDTYSSNQILSKGGNGIIFEAVGSKTKKPVAIKVPTLELTEDNLTRFSRELEISFNLNHPNIVQAVDTGILLDSRPFLVMELINGLTLDEYRHPSSWTEARELFLQLCSAVDYVHQRHIVHRDIKPKNILVTPSGKVKLLDFGIAKATYHRSITLNGVFIGSVGHSSVDSFGMGYHSTSSQLRSSPHPKDDLVSLGVILYELVTNQVPWIHICPAYNELSQMARLLSIGLMDDQTKLELKINIALHVPPQLRKIIGNALDPDRNRRYSSVSELVADVISIPDNFELPYVPDRSSFPLRFIK